MAGFDNIIAGLTGHNAGGGLQGNPLMDIGLGLLSVAGPSTQPRSIGDGLLAGIKLSNERQAAQLNNALAREKLKEAQDARNAVAEQKAAAQRVFGNGETSSGLLGNLGLSSAQQGLLGAYAQTDPQGAMSLLGNIAFPQERSAPADVRTAQFLYPDNPDQQRQFVLKQAENSGANDQMLQALDIKLKMLQAQQTQNQMDQTATDTAKQNAEFETSVIQDINHGKEMASLLKDLEGTALETGVALPDMRRAAAASVGALGDLLGFDTGKAKDLAAKLDRFDTLATNFGVTALKQALAGNKLGQTEFQQLLGNSTSIYKTTAANRLAIADILEKELAAAKASGIPLSNEKDVRSLIDNLRANPEGPKPQPVVNVPQIIDQGMNAIDQGANAVSNGVQDLQNNGVIDFNDYKE